MDLLVALYSWWWASAITILWATVRPYKSLLWACLQMQSERELSLNLVGQHIHSNFFKHTEFEASTSPNPNPIQSKKINCLLTSSSSVFFWAVHLQLSLYKTIFMAEASIWLFHTLPGITQNYAYMHLMIPYLINCCKLGSIFI